VNPLVASNKGLCSIEIGPEGIAIAYTPNQTSPEITICDFQPYQNNSQFSPDKLEEYLVKIVSLYNLRKTPCNLVLHPDYYRLTLINTPNVPMAEYKQALRWQIKDIISYPLEDVAVDIFYPDEPEKSLKKIYVIAAQKSFLQNITDIIQKCDLLPIAIDIREFAIRNLIAKMAKQNESIGVLNIIKENCLMVLVKQYNIHFVRYMPINMANIKSGNYNELITEIQRSFNYCQTELNQEIPSKFLMSSKENLDHDIVQNIAQLLNKELAIFTLKEIVNFKTQVNQQMETNCWIAVGGALRNSDKEKT